MNSAKKSPTPNEIDEIMNEIQHLQEGMSGAVQQSKETRSVKSPASTAPVESKASELKAESKPELKVVPTMEPEALVESAMEEFHAPASADGPSMEETLGSMKPEEAVGNSLLGGAAEAEDSSEELVTGSTQETEDFDQEIASVISEDTISEGETGMQNSDEGTMTLQMSGAMNLRLKYEIDGQEVTIGFVDQQLRVELADGTEFRIPLHRGGRGLKSVG